LSWTQHATAVADSDVTLAGSDDAEQITDKKDRHARTLVSACDVCGSGMVTPERASISSAACTCPEEEYYSPKAGKCKACLRGMTCPRGSSVENIGLPGGMQVGKGFYVDNADEPLEVFQCEVMGDSAAAQGFWEPRCMGGPMRACVKGSSGLNCGRCDDGWFPNGMGLCEECKDTDNVTIFILITVITFLPAGFYYLLNGKNTTMMACSLAMAIAKFNFITTLALENLPFEWAEEFRITLMLVRVLAFDFNSVTSQCVFGNQPLTQWLVVISIPIWLVVCLFGSSFLSRRFCGKDSSWRMEKPETFNTFGTVYQAVFITIVIGIIAPFRCYPHPNDSEKMSLVKYPEVICGDAEHIPMLIIAVFVFLFTVANYFTYNCQKVMALPSMSHDDNADPTWRRALKFMIYRFRHGAWYWGVPFLLRSILIGVSSIIAPGQIFTQMNVCMFVLLFYLVIQCYIWPWKNHALNVVDLLLGFNMIGMTAAALPFTGKPLKDVVDQASAWVILWFASASLAMIWYFAYLLVMEFRKWLKPQLRADILKAEQELHLATAQDLTKICSKVSAAWETEEDMRELARFMKLLGPYDVALLQKMVYMLNFELFSTDKNKDELALQVLRKSSGQNGFTAVGNGVMRVRSF
jgi:hypothetical protein